MEAKSELEILFSYANKDEELQKELEKRLSPFEMEVVMEDQILRVDEEQEAISDADLARKLSKKEQRLSARLVEAQEDEARAQDRFQRAQARLQRRRDRLERIKSHLVLVQEQIADLQTIAQQPEQVESVLIIPATSEPALITDSEGSAPAQSELEVVAIPESEAIPLSAPESDISTTIEPELVATPESEAISHSTIESDTSTTIEPELVATPESEAISHSTIESDISTTIEPEVDVTTDSTTVDVPTTIEQEAISPSNTESDTSTTIEPEVDATPEVDTSSDSTIEREATISLRLEQETTPIAGLLPQEIQSAKEAWVAAESAVQNARNTAHGIAASISFLSQTSEFSDEFMAELVRKQAEANKALVKAQEATRSAYERFVQAQENAEHAASQSVDVSMGASEDHTQQKQENGALPAAEEGNATDQTVRMHAIRLYKAW